MTITQIGTHGPAAAGSDALPEGTGTAELAAGSRTDQNPETQTDGTGTVEPTKRPGSTVPEIQRPWEKRAAAKNGTEPGTQNQNGSRSTFPGLTAAADLTDEQLDNMDDDEFEEHLRRLAAGEFDTPRDWVGLMLWTAIWSVTGVATYMAAVGQIDGTWIWAGQNPHDFRRFGVPFLFEVGVIAWLLIGKFAMTKHRSPYPWWVVAATFATLAVYTNSVHGEGPDGWREGVLFGTASALSLALWFAKFYLDYMAHEVAGGRRRSSRPKVITVANVVTQPRLTFRAHLIVMRRHEVATDGQAFVMAELWQWIYQDTVAVRVRPNTSSDAEKAQVGPDRNRSWRERHRIARRTAWLHVNRELGVKTIIPQGVEIAEVRFAEPPAVEPRPERPRDRRRDQKPPEEPENFEVPATRLPSGSRGSGGENPVMLDKDRPDPAWFLVYQDRFPKVADALPNWRTYARTGRLTTDMVQDNGVGNRTHAGHVRKCLIAIAYNQVPTDGLKFVPGSMR